MSTFNQPATPKVTTGGGFLIHSPRNLNGATGNKKKHDVQKSLMAAIKRGAVVNPRSPNSPGAMQAPAPGPPVQFPPPKLPFDPRKMDLVYDESRKVEERHRDEALGTGIARLFPAPAQRVRDQYRITETTATKVCSDQGLIKQRHASVEFPNCYMSTSRWSEHNFFKHPVVFLKDVHAKGANALRPSEHGFAYVPDEVYEAIARLGRFHLFNGYDDKNQGDQPDDAFRKWRYCGVFAVHKTPYALSQPGWLQLSDEAKFAAAQFRALSSGKVTASTCTPEAVRPFLMEFYSDTARMRLVLFESTGFPSEYAQHLLKRDVEAMIPVARGKKTRAIPPRAQIEREAREEAQARFARVVPKPTRG